MKCPICRTDNPSDSRFCKQCAAPLTGSGQEGPFPTKTMDSPDSAVRPGTVIAGHYEIVEKLGKGGMGEVYRAADKNLGRQVAIKILPEEFSHDQERMARFGREAKLLAGLNHPNIASVYGFEEANERRFLVMELVEGESLKTRLDRGPLSMDDALEAGRQVAEGLEAAHDKGVVHRDLKPGNIMITPDGKVKILDFGLAKAFEGETAGVDIVNSPTITAQMTEPGVILGTAAYMSPEQARGRSVDKRTDIWAFGCVLYECLTGRLAFHGETVSDTLAHILKGEPDWAALPADTPAAILVLARRCLQKDIKKRLQHIGDARIEIEEALAHPAVPTPAKRRFSLGWLLASCAAVLLAGVLIGLALRRPSQAAAVSKGVTAVIKLEPGTWLDGRRSERYFQRPSRTALAISRDGSFIVYSAIAENPDPQAKPRLYLRKMDQWLATPIKGTEGAICPFLSPDDRWVGFWADGKLMKVAIGGGVPVILCDVLRPFGASWGPDNSIIFPIREDTGLFKISADGGKPEALTAVKKTENEYSHRLPRHLPGGKALLFTLSKEMLDGHPRTAILNLETREWRELMEDAADARYVPTGHLVFLRQGTLMAVPFDAAKGELKGQPIPVVADVVQELTGYFSMDNSAAGQFAVSDSGLLVYAPGKMVPPFQDSLVWVDRKGETQPAISYTAPFHSPRLSPDGTRIAYTTLGTEMRVWIYDLERGTPFRLTSEGTSGYVTWDPKGERLIFNWWRSGHFNLYWQPADGSLPAEQLTARESLPQIPGAMSRDGTTLAFADYTPETDYDVVLLDVPTRRVTSLLNSRASETGPAFSPDGRWLAYSSNETGRSEVYVIPVSGPGGKTQISRQGGSAVLWSKMGNELFYRRGNEVWVADTKTEGGFSSGKPRLLFEKPGFYSSGWDLSSDGRRFLMIKLEDRKPQPVTELVLVQNWFEDLKRLVPAGKK
jgi:predicted Ser/Thr protein kinase